MRPTTLNKEYKVLSLYDVIMYIAVGYVALTYGVVLYFGAKALVVGFAALFTK